MPTKAGKNGPCCKLRPFHKQRHHWLWRGGRGVTRKLPEITDLKTCRNEDGVPEEIPARDLISDGGRMVCICPHGTPNREERCSPTNSLSPAVWLSLSLSELGPNVVSSEGSSHRDKSSSLVCQTIYNPLPTPALCLLAVLPHIASPPPASASTLSRTQSSSCLVVPQQLALASVPMLPRASSPASSWSPSRPLLVSFSVMTPVPSLVSLP